MLVGILPQIGKLIDKDNIVIDNLYLSTKDGYMMPPNIPINVLFKKDKMGHYKSDDIIMLKMIKPQKSG